MAKSVKFFYILIIFVSIYLGVVNSQPCFSDRDCYLKNPKAPLGQVECYDGFCRCLIESC